MVVSTTPGQRFTQLIQQLGLTKNAFAQSLGKTATVIQHIVDERNKPGYDLMNKVREVYPNVLGDWLLFGEGPMLRNDAVLAVAADTNTSAPVADGIDPADIPAISSRRRPGDRLLQPADIAATLALATSAPDKANSSAARLSQGSSPEPASGASPSAVVAESTPAAPATAPLAATAAPAPLAAPLTPDPVYLAALLQTQQLQHQLALAEQRNQHLLEQQALLQQMLALLQR